MAELDKPLRKLNQKYREYLNKQKAAFQGGGNLQGVIAVEGELETFEQAPAPELSTFPELKRLQIIYREQRSEHEAGIIKSKLELARHFKKSAEVLIQETTRAGKIDQAKALLAESAKFGQEEDTLAALMKTDRSPKSSLDSAEMIRDSELTQDDVPRPPPLPTDRQRIVNAGGILGIWGIFDGKPVDDSLKREVGRLLRDRDYIKVAVGQSTYHYKGGQHKTVSILAVRKNKKGILVTVPPAVVAEDGGGYLVKEYDEVSYIEHNGYPKVAFLADQSPFGNPNESDEVRLDDSSILAVGQDVYILREAGGQFLTLGALRHFAERRAELFGLECQVLSSDKARFLVVNARNDIIWINARNELRFRRLAGDAKEFGSVEIEPQPSEPIVHLAGAGRQHGKWIALGESGKIYAEKLGGFAEPATDWGLARALRFPDGRNDPFVLQKLDGSWAVQGNDNDMQAFLSELGPAIDLDVCRLEDKGKVLHRIVAWVEPENRLR